MDVRLPDGTIIQNVPDGISKADLVAKLKSNGHDVSGLEQASAPDVTQADPIDQTYGMNIGGGLKSIGNLAAGAVRGAGSIGATLMYPVDKITDIVKGDRGPSLSSLVSGQQPLSRNEERRQQMTDALQTMGADPGSLSFKAGRLGSEVAGTLGVGGSIANGARAIPALAKFAPLIESGGFNLGNAATGNSLVNLLMRAGGGAIQGGASAGLVDPKNAKMGAIIGGALPGAVQAAGAIGSGIKSGVAALTKNTLGMTTGAGSQAVGTAYQAGKAGSQEFLDNMRGQVPVSDVLDKAKGALREMRLARGEEYRKGMAAVSGDKSVIDFTPIEQAMNKIQSMGSYKGQAINKNASGTVDDLGQLVNQWKGLDKAEFHTPEGFDALKQAIGDIRDSLQYGSPARKAADTIYNAVKSEITTQAPTYSKVMKGYSDSSQLIDEIERTLSLKPNASVDASMRKLQSLMRNNVNTNYGNRLQLARELENSGGKQILNDVAGQALNSWTPRGLQAVGATPVAAYAMLSNPAAAAALLPASPRLVGEAAYGLGALNRGIGSASSKTANKLAELMRSGNTPLMRQQAMNSLTAAIPVLLANQR